MPSEFLHFPSAYSIVGLYRLTTDPSIRKPVWDKIKHATVRGAVIALAYAALSWKLWNWLIIKFIFNPRSGVGKVVGKNVKEDIQGLRPGGNVKVGFGRFSAQFDAVFCEWLHVMMHLR